MNLRGACLLQDATGIGRINTATGHNDDAPVCLLHQTAKQIDTCLSSGCLARSEDAVKTELYKSFKCCKRIAAEIKSTMERHGDGRKEISLLKITFGKINILTLSSIEEAAASLYVDITIGGKGSYHHAIDTGTASCEDIIDNDVLLDLSIEEVTATGPNEDILSDAINSHGSLYKTDAGCQSTHIKTATEFYTGCSTLCGVQHGRNRTSTDF